MPVHLKESDAAPLPIQVLLSPFQKKFRVFFFSNSSKLNDCTKPEYYFGVVLKWMQNHRKFIEDTVEELFASYSACVDFCTALVLLTCDKVNSDLKIIPEDDSQIFSHLVDEILSYDNDFTSFMPELTDRKRPINILQNDQSLIDRWIRFEFESAAQT